MTFSQATPRAAWQNKGRFHALKGLPSTPPPQKKERDWYMTGYRNGKIERLRNEAEGSNE